MIDDGYTTTVLIQKIQYGTRHRLSRQLAESLRFAESVDHVANTIVMDIEVALLTETLPPERIVDRASFTVPRFAGWFDAFVATYRQRWWGRLLRLREPRFVDEPLTHETTVSVLAGWTYPEADSVLDGRDWGHVVLRANDVRVASMLRPW